MEVRALLSCPGACHQTGLQRILIHRREGGGREEGEREEGETQRKNIVEWLLGDNFLVTVGGRSLSEGLGAAECVCVCVCALHWSEHTCDDACV